MKDRDFWKKLTPLVFPLAFQQLMSALVGTSDTLMMGLLNQASLSAVSLATQITFVTSLFTFGLTGAGSLLAAQYWGKGSKPEVEQVFAVLMRPMVLVGSLFTLAAAFLPGLLMRIFTPDPELIALGSSYLRAVSLSYLLNFINQTYLTIMRNSGRASTATVIGSTGVVLNIGLNALLIFGLLGMPALGAVGAALATTLSNVVSLGYCLMTFFRLRNESVISFHPKYFSFRYMKQIFSVGLSSFLNALLASTSNLVIVRLSANYSDIAVAAYGIAKKLDQLPLKSVTGLCQGIMPIIGYNYGAGNYKRMNGTLSFSWKTTLVFCGAFVLIFELFANPILFLFIPEAETAALGASLLRIACLAVPFHSINNLISYAIQGMGLGEKSSRLTLLRHGALNIPLMFVLDHFFGLFGMICSRLLAEVIVLPIAAFTYRKALRDATK